MAARIRRGTKDNPWHESVRLKIKSSMLKNRLEKHALGKCDMTPTQVRAAEILLDRTMPRMAAIEHTGDVQTSYIVRMPAQVSTLEEWNKQYTTADTEQSQQVSSDPTLTTH